MSFCVGSQGDLYTNFVNPFHVVVGIFPSKYIEKILWLLAVKKKKSKILNKFRRKKKEVANKMYKRQKNVEKVKKKKNLN